LTNHLPKQQLRPKKEQQQQQEEEEEEDHGQIRFCQRYLVARRTGSDDSRATYLLADILADIFSNGGCRR
jgi:hypothetical protein